MGGASTLADQLTCVVWGRDGCWLGEVCGGGNGGKSLASVLGRLELLGESSWRFLGGGGAGL